MVDQPLADFSRVKHSLDLRLDDVHTAILRGAVPLEHVHDCTGRSVFNFVIDGTFLLHVEGLHSSPIEVPSGTAVGFESGRAHKWTALRPASPEGQCALFIGSIPTTMALVRGVRDGIIVVPNDAEPFSTTLRLSIAVHVHAHENPDADGDGNVARRCAEIGLIQIVNYMRATIAHHADTPEGLAHDDNLLRAWSAYVAAPRRRWTLQELANAAGLSRTVFAERFLTVFGAPPFRHFRSLRLEHAKTLLKDSKASLMVIAFEVGYNSEAAFVRAFHREYGKTPGRFRLEAVPD